MSVWNCCVFLSVGVFCKVASCDRASVCSFFFCVFLCDFFFFFFCQAEDGIRDLVRSRGLGDVYKRQIYGGADASPPPSTACASGSPSCSSARMSSRHRGVCLLYTSDAADERSSVDLGGRRIIKKKT